MVVKVDYGDGSDFLPLEPGDYRANIFEIEERESQKGNTYLRLTLKLLKPFERRRLWFNLTLIPSTMWRVRQVLSRIEGKDATDYIGEGTIDEKAMLGVEIVVSVGAPNEDFGDGTINEVLDIWGTEGPPAGMKEPKALDPKKAIAKAKTKEKTPNKGKKKATGGY